MCSESFMTESWREGGKVSVPVFIVGYAEQVTRDYLSPRLRFG